MSKRLFINGLAAMFIMIGGYKRQRRRLGPPKPAIYMFGRWCYV